jgi:hypothetical protein
MPARSWSPAPIDAGGVDVDSELVRLFGTGVRPLHLEQALFDAILAGWVRQQRARLLSDLTSKTANAPVSPQTASTSKAVKSIERSAASQFAVFARPQTAKDRSLPAVVRRSDSAASVPDSRMS